MNLLIQLICAVLVAAVAYVLAGSLGLPYVVCLIAALVGLYAGWRLGTEFA